MLFVTHRTLWKSIAPKRRSYKCNDAIMTWLRQYLCAFAQRIVMNAHTHTQLAAVPGAATTRDPATRDFVFNHTMLRVKDPQVSLDFYTRVLGFTLVRNNDFEKGMFSLYFLALVDDGDEITDDAAARRTWIARQRGLRGLDHIYGNDARSGCYKPVAY